jgi:hypothetical protein
MVAPKLAAPKPKYSWSAPEIMNPTEQMVSVRDFLIGLSIQSAWVETSLTLKVSRDDMIRVGRGTWEQEHYDDVLNTIQTLFPQFRFHWGGKDDDYLYLNSLIWSQNFKA